MREKEALHSTGTPSVCVHEMLNKYSFHVPNNITLRCDSLFRSLPTMNYSTVIRLLSGNRGAERMWGRKDERDGLPTWPCSQHKRKSISEIPSWGAAIRRRARKGLIGIGIGIHLEGIGRSEWLC